MTYLCNDMAEPIGAIRRTLKLADYECITLEIPIQHTGNLELDIWNTILFINTILIDWAQHISAGHYYNPSSGPTNIILTEIEYAKTHISKLTNKAVERT